MNIHTLGQNLSALGQAGSAGLFFEVVPIPGEVDVLQVIVEDREECPIFLSACEEQLLCIAYLARQDEIEPSKVAELNSAMLTANVNVPLSSFGLIEDRYVIFGALSTSSHLQDIVHELAVLSSNTIEAMEVMQEFLSAE